LLDIIFIFFLLNIVPFDAVFLVSKVFQLTAPSFNRRSKTACGSVDHLVWSIEGEESKLSVLTISYCSASYFFYISSTHFPMRSEKLIIGEDKKLVSCHCACLVWTKN